MVNKITSGEALVELHNTGNAVYDAVRYEYHKAFNKIARELQYDLFGASIIYERKHKGIKKIKLLDPRYFEEKETLLIEWEV